MSHHSGSAPQFDPQVPYFSEAAVREVLRYEDLIPAMERALIDFSSGKVLQPVRSILPVEQYHGFFGIMPAVYGDIMGAKLVTLFPNNGDHWPSHPSGHHRAAARHDWRTARRSRWTTDHRNAHRRGHGRRHKAAGRPERSGCLAILGSGVQARAHLEGPASGAGLSRGSHLEPQSQPRQALADGDRRNRNLRRGRGARRRCRGHRRQRV